MSDVRAIVTINERGVIAGELYPADSPLVQVNPQWFAAVPKIPSTPTPAPAPVPARATVSQPPVVEATTAAPGEVRQTRSTGTAQSGG